MTPVEAQHLKVRTQESQRDMTKAEDLPVGSLVTVGECGCTFKVLGCVDLRYPEHVIFRQETSCGHPLCDFGAPGRMELWLFRDGLLEKPGCKTFRLV